MRALVGKVWEFLHAVDTFLVEGQEFGLLGDAQGGAIAWRPSSARGKLARVC